jgi:hypothetical protein
MTLLFPDDAAKIVDKPRLHAIVIGVADYPHLNGGAGPAAADPLNLGQVTTPRHTALEIVRWLMEGYRNAETPLGSVELVLSPSEPVKNSAGLPVNVETATFQHIDEAFTRWVGRCSANKANIAFFYFCGHGLAKDEQFILPEDFKNPAILDTWRNCINFDATRVGMRSCKAQTQVFFVDACRETPFGMLTDVDVEGRKLISSAVGDSVKCSATYYATTEGKQAFGPEKEVTYFGRAVVHCFKGLAASNSAGKWAVDTYSLAKSLGEVMRHYAEIYSEPLDCNPNVVGLGKIHEPPHGMVIARIKCSTAEATAAAEIEMRRLGVSHKVGVNDKKPLIKEVEPGDWQIIVTFPAGEFQAPPPMNHQLSPALFEGVEFP